MSVTMERIRQSLADTGRTVQLWGDADCIVDTLHVVSDAASQADDALNICPLSFWLALPQARRRENCWLCCEDVPLPEPFPGQEEGLNLLLCRDERDTAILVNDVGAVFSEELRYARCCSRLFNALSGRHVLPTILAVAGSYLDRPMVLGDNNHIVLAHTVSGVAAEEKEWLRFVELGVAPSFIGDEETQQTREVPGESFHQVFFSRNRRTGIEHAVCDVYFRGRCLASLAILVGETPLNAWQQRLLFVICDAIALELGHREEPDTSRGLPYENILIDLLENRVHDMSYTRMMAHKIPLPIEGFFAVYVFELPPERIDRQAPVRQLMDTIEVLLPDSRVVNHNGHITAVVNFGTIERFTAQNYEELENLIARFGLLCGMSRPFPNLDDLHWHYLSAIDAASFGRYSVFIDPSILDSRINYFERCETYVMVHHAMERGVELKKFIHPFALRLYEHDKNHDTSYLRTLYEYIRTPKKAQAAEALFIHRNTLDYRLKKILEIIPFSRDDGETLSRIYFSCIILFYLEARSEYERQKPQERRDSFLE